jgi:hypothetical protein
VLVPAAGHGREVGATQYVQMVNSDFAVYSKSGKVLRPATPIDQLWKGYEQRVRDPQRR